MRSTSMRTYLNLDH
ncbi:hypothetical protein LINPERPRIM_LOCUS40991 [Linum perenne]